MIGIGLYPYSFTKRGKIEYGDFTIFFLVQGIRSFHSAGLIESKPM